MIKKMAWAEIVILVLFFLQIAAWADNTPEPAEELPYPNITLPDTDSNEEVFTAPSVKKSKKKAQSTSVKINRTKKVYPRTKAPTSSVIIDENGKKTVIPSTPAPQEKAVKTSKSKLGSPAQRNLEPATPAPSAKPAAGKTTVVKIENNPEENNSTLTVQRERLKEMPSQPDAKKASADSPIRPVIGPSRNMNFLVMGSSYLCSARFTGIDDEYLVVADSSIWPQVAKQYGANLRWDKRRNRLTVTSEGKIFTLNFGQATLSREAGGRHLDVMAQQIDGVAYFPVSCLEDFLKVRVTVDKSGRQAWIDPLITSVRFEGEGAATKLVVRSTAPLSFKTFKLSRPDRYVIDIPGGVLDTSSLRINHPEVGDVRLGQFTLGPAVSRIVVPITGKVKVSAPSRTAAKQLAFAVSLPTAQSQFTAGKSEKLQDYRIENVTEKGVIAGRRITLQFSGPVNYQWQRLSGVNERFVLDLSRVIAVNGRKDINVDAPNIRSLRISQYKASPAPVTRVVLDLKNAAEISVSPGQAPNSLMLIVMHQAIDSQTALLRGYGSTTAALPVSGIRTICIDAGHGGSDSGCVHGASGVMEKDVTLDICMQLAEILRSQGWNVLMTRETDRDVTWAGSSNSEELWGRCKVANEGNADIFISVHCNASANASAVGTSIHVYKRADRVLADEMHGHLINASGRMDRGVQQDRFYVLAHTTMPAVLIETAFLSNDTEARLLATPQYRRKVAQGLADGLNSYAGKFIIKQSAAK